MIHPIIAEASGNVVCILIFNALGKFWSIAMVLVGITRIYVKMKVKICFSLCKYSRSPLV